MRFAHGLRADPRHGPAPGHIPSRPRED
jgi:hypothetical protein